MSEVRRLGRPPVDNPKNVKLTVRVDKETSDILDSYCQNAGIKRMDGIRIALYKLKEDL